MSVKGTAGERHPGSRGQCLVLGQEECGVQGLEHRLEHTLPWLRWEPSWSAVHVGPLDQGLQLSFTGK